MKLLDNKFSPLLTRKHLAFKELLSSKVLRQLDLEQDSGDSLEDEWEEGATYLADDFVAGPLPKPRDEM